MKAMILAAGLGTRLRPLTDSLPKPLLPVAGTPLIVWNLLLLRKHGIHDVLVNLHYLGDLIEKELGDGSKWGMSLTYSHEWTLLGTGGGIKQAQSFFGEEPFLV
jgi:NDP-sugar pyrophosphorylase family protein